MAVKLFATTTMSRGIQKLYSEAARTYEMINHLLTLGLDVLWRKKASEIAVRTGGSLWVDVCSGTGEMAMALKATSGGRARVVSADFSTPMLKVAKSKRGAFGLQFALADAGSLPFRSNVFDLVTIAYATRNLNPNRDKLVRYLEEFRRVLRPGGTFANLETSQPRSLITRYLYHLYVHVVVRRLGAFISGSKSGYAFLSSTVLRFYSPREFAALLREAGFEDIRVVRLMLGVFAIHMASPS